MSLSFHPYFYFFMLLPLKSSIPSVNYCDGLDRRILYCILFVFMLALLCFCVAAEFSVNKDLYKFSRGPAAGVLCSFRRSDLLCRRPPLVRFKEKFDEN